MSKLRRFGVVLILFIAAPALPQEPPTLDAEEVLRSSAAHFPLILEALAARRAAEGDVLEAQGAFDLVFGADGFNRATGFYDGTVVTGTSRQRFRQMGTSVYAGYKLSDGDFPVYEDRNFTNSGGELTVGVLFSLLRDRDIDPERFGLLDTELSLREADQDVLMTKIGVQRRALIAYWAWVTAGRQLNVYRNLLRIAEERESGLEQQVLRGARAEIFLVENRQNITRRETLVTAAERDFRLAANELSFYFRDGDGNPVLPPPERLPPAAETPRADLVMPGEVSPMTAEALLRRPELARLRATIERARNRISLAENALKPRLDLNLSVDHDFGGVAEGGVERDATDTKVGFTFSVPFQQRSARGQIYTAEAELSALRQQQRRTQDQIEIEVRNILVALDAAEELLSLAEEQVTQTETMRNAEQRRFESGASDFFLVNIREETAADARVMLHQARLDREIALTDYYAATVELQRLGITD